MTAADSLQVGGSATLGPGAWRGTRSLVSPRLLGSYSSSLSNPQNVRRILVSCLTILAFPSLRVQPIGCAFCFRHRREPLAADPGEPWRRWPPWVLTACRLLSCFLASLHGVFPLGEVTAFLTLLELRPLLHSLQVPATSAPPGNVSSSSRIRLP